MKETRSSTFRYLISCLATCFIVALGTTTRADDNRWQSDTIADALQAAPRAVTDDATILGWTTEGKLQVARYGPGPYTCIASGSFSIRLGKPALPYPDPMCLDQNAWAFLQAIWRGNPPGGSVEDLPRAPGLVWMLTGMNVTRSAVDVGASTIAVTENTVEAGMAEVVQMTPHVMIMPLPFDEDIAHLSTRYSLDDPLGAWIMAAGKPHEHLMVHFSDADTQALMKAGE